ncbi:MAG: hypothetical protein MUE44_21895 [Oscillatoriaceae cyanobacterium Prado104]|nr:hypothetical protein [Oscillatoriaceae cyanobacterium Prado104]
MLCQQSRSIVFPTAIVTGVILEGEYYFCCSTALFILRLLIVSSYRGRSTGHDVAIANDL